MKEAWVKLQKERTLHLAENLSQFVTCLESRCTDRFVLNDLCVENWNIEQRATCITIHIQQRKLEFMCFSQNADSANHPSCHMYYESREHTINYVNSRKCHPDTSSFKSVLAKHYIKVCLAHSTSNTLKNSNTSTNQINNFLSMHSS